MTFGMLRVYNVSWLWHGCSETDIVFYFPITKRRVNFKWMSIFHEDKINFVVFTHG
jgi:hypothetical protein